MKEEEEEEHMSLKGSERRGKVDEFKCALCNYGASTTGYFFWRYKNDKYKYISSISATKSCLVASWGVVWVSLRARQLYLHETIHSEASDKAEGYGITLCHVYNAELGLAVKCCLTSTTHAKLN